MAKTCKNNVSFFKKMIVNGYANNVLRVLNCMPQHYIHTMYCYKTSTTNDIEIHSVYNYAALQNNPKARNYSDSEVSKHGKRNSL